MSWPFYLVPVPDGALFTPEALGEMSRWWDRYPVYRRPDGAIALCRDAEHRDYVLDTGTTGRADDNIEGIVLLPESVVFHIAGWPDRIDTIADFVEFCQSRWSCKFVDQTKRTYMTPEEYRTMMHKTFDYPKQH